jgi:hypothetical protein
MGQTGPKTPSATTHSLFTAYLSVLSQRIRGYRDTPRIDTLLTTPTLRTIAVHTYLRLSFIMLLTGSPGFRSYDGKACYISPCYQNWYTNGLMHYAQIDWQVSEPALLYSTVPLLLVPHPQCDYYQRYPAHQHQEGKQVPPYRVI